MKLVSSLLLLLLAALPAFGQQATREDFKEYCQAMAGRWVNEVTWEADWPGVGKRGEKVTAYAESRLSDDGHALVGRFLAGNGSGTFMVVYDAAAKEIRGNGVDSGGTTWVYIIYRKDGRWTSKETGSLPDGTKYEGLYTVTISDNGNTHRWTGSTKIPGKKTDEVNNVGRRVSK